jgi:hypothetical protein
VSAAHSTHSRSASGCEQQLCPWRTQELRQQAAERKAARKRAGGEGGEAEEPELDPEALLAAELQRRADEGDEGDSSDGDYGAADAAADEAFERCACRWPVLAHLSQGSWLSRGAVHRLRRFSGRRGMPLTLSGCALQ